MKSIPEHSDSIVGDECHIIPKCSQKAGGLDPMSRSRVDHYSNLILLCKVDHKRVDDQRSIYTNEVLHETKEKHEKWVSETLHQANSAVGQQHDNIAVRMQTGKEILSLVGGAYLYDFDYDEPLDEVEQQLVGDFLQTLQDWGDIGDEVEPAERVRIGCDLTGDIQALSKTGYEVFGASSHQRVRLGDSDDVWRVATVRVVRASNPNIVRRDPVEASLGREEGEDSLRYPASPA